MAIRKGYGVFSYAQAHHRTRRAKGRADEHACVDCGGPADHWSYDGKDPNAYFGRAQTLGGLMLWSDNPDHYEPRCKPCHKQYDTTWSQWDQGQHRVAAQQG